MDSVEIKIFRERYTNKQTLGSCVVRKNNIFVGSFVVLEKVDLNNEPNISCIPTGTYKLEHWNSEKHPNSFVVKDVPNRFSILIHTGNYYFHSEGCILFGGMFEDINADGLQDVIYSAKAME